MSSLRDDWDKFTMEVNNTLAQLKLAISRWEDYSDSKTRLEKWIQTTETNLAKIPDTKGELSEMKTMLERFRHLKDEITSKRSDLDRLSSEATELSSWSKCPTQLEEINRLQARWDQLNVNCDLRVKDLESEINDYNSYHQSLQDAEKWLLQISFQLMAHNSLYITNRDQTKEQISQHEALLDDVQKYQSNLDDLNAKGKNQIDRYVKTTPYIRNTIETQLKNIQESYNSLLNTSVQIRNRLQDSLAKFQEYEDTLDGILKNLDEYEPIITTELDEPATNLEMAQEQLQCAQNLHNKLQNEKSRLAIAVQACEAATASISRPSSPLDTTQQPIPEKELMVRARLEDLIDQVWFIVLLLSFFYCLNAL